MNQTVNLGAGAGLSLGVLAAGVLLFYAVWVGRRALGVRAAGGVLAATVLSTFLPLLLLMLPSRGFTSSFPPIFLLTGILGPLLAFLPLYVAANWLEVIRGAARLEGRTENPPVSEMRTKRSGGEKLDQQGVNVLSSLGV